MCSSRYHSKGRQRRGPSPPGGGGPRLPPGERYHYLRSHPFYKRKLHEKPIYNPKLPLTVCKAIARLRRREKIRRKRLKFQASATGKQQNAANRLLKVLEVMHGFGRAGAPTACAASA